MFVDMSKGKSKLIQMGYRKGDNHNNTIRVPYLDTKAQ